MKVREILRFAKDSLHVRLAKGGDSEVTALCQDSRLFKSGDLFFAVKGALFDGHSFVTEACRRGASGVVIEKTSLTEGNANWVPPDFKGAVIECEDTRGLLRDVAAPFFGFPSTKLFVAGVTGTNGKTTTSHLIEAVLNQGGLPTGVVGTIDCHLGSEKKPSPNTTPDALDLQSTLAEWVKQGAKALSIEVSSHAIALGRADHLDFDCAVFTNLTRDHLDFHKTMESYSAAKARLFNDLLEASQKKNKRAILNRDDPEHMKMKPSHANIWTYGLERGDFHCRDLRLGLDDTKFEAVTPAGVFPVSLKIIGRHNVSNALAAFAVGLHAGVAAPTIAQGLAKLEGVRGRLQRVTASSPLRVFVDYAHSDDALTNVLGFLKNLRDQTSQGARIITVFGCGGDRDKGKRPLMLRAARAFSDLIIVTSDNPRTEDPEQITKDILSEVTAQPGGLPANIMVDVDRRRAIELAITGASPRDVILIAGKGHEDYQIIGTKKWPFDDVQVAREILNS